VRTGALAKAGQLPDERQQRLPRRRVGRHLTDRVTTGHRFVESSKVVRHEGGVLDARITGKCLCYLGLWVAVDGTFAQPVDHHMRAAIGRLRVQLDEFEGLLDPGRGEELRQWLDAAAAKRAALLQQKLREVTPD